MNYTSIKNKIDRHMSDIDDEVITLLGRIEELEKENEELQEKCTKLEDDYNSILQDTNE